MTEFKSKMFKFHHIGYVVNSIKEDARFLKPLINSKEKYLEHKDYNQNVNVCFYKSINDGYIELIEPLTKNSPISKYLIKNKGGGIHHICYETKNIEKCINYFTKHNFIKITDIKKGFENRDVVFLLSKKRVELIIELVSYAQKIIK